MTPKDNILISGNSDKQIPKRRISKKFTLTWKNAETDRPREGGRYWCIVREINSLGVSYYQWNCAYAPEYNRWTSNSLIQDVVWWTELAPNPF